MQKIPVAMTIAGSDSGGGAGVQADLKTFAVMGVHGTSAITSITAQNTREVRAIHDIPPDIVVSQIEAVADDIGVDAAKTGMLSNSEIIRAVAKTIDKYGFPLVVDPVMVAKSGARLLRQEAIDILKEVLIPRATIVTPNIPEAEVLTGVKIVDKQSQREAAKIIVEELGARAAVVKGGHLGGGEALDILYHGGEFIELRGEKISRRTTHGTGCVFSAAIAAGLAKKRSISDAVKVAKEVVTVAIKYGLEVGRGAGPVNPTAFQAIAAERWRVISSLKKAAEILKQEEEKVAKIIPEVQMNIAMSLPPLYARSILDVAAFPGRIGRTGNRLVFKSDPEFGASEHMARLVLAAQDYNPAIRSAANIKYKPEIIGIARELGLSVARVDRRREPLHVRSREGATLPWMVTVAFEKYGRVPDIIYDEGDIGKEPMIRILAESAERVAEIITLIARKL